jgi:ComF family protein
MIDGILELIAPHLCSGCGRVGSLLCEDCKSDIISQPFIGCIACQTPNMSGVCAKHHLPYAKAWVVGERKDVLQRLIGSFKFLNAKSGARILAQLLDERLPVLPKETIIVSIPTIPSHVRERGYDHARLIAEQFAKMRKLPLERPIERQNKSVQKRADKKLRAQQAQHAFRVTKPLKETAKYLIIDDVVTTGATLEYASELLRRAGASTVWVAVLARQPLD